jgi:Leu/Phe-tRNA-protein transferase
MVKRGDPSRSLRRKFAQYKVRFNNGHSVVVNGVGDLSDTLTRKGLSDYYFKLVDEGFAHSISGILPSGDEAVIYM